MDWKTRDMLFNYHERAAFLFVLPLLCIVLKFSKTSICKIDKYSTK